MSTRRLLHIGQRQRTRQTALALSELLTLLVSCHWRPYRTFQHDYPEYVAVHLRPAFPQLVSYQRFVALIPRALIPLCGDRSTRKGRCTGIACINSTPLAGCDNHRMATHTGLECPFTHNMARLPRYASNATLPSYASDRVTIKMNWLRVLQVALLYTKHAATTLIPVQCSVTVYHALI